MKFFVPLLALGICCSSSLVSNRTTSTTIVPKQNTVIIQSIGNQIKKKVDDQIKEQVVTKEETKTKPKANEVVKSNQISKSNIPVSTTPSYYKCLEAAETKQISSGAKIPYTVFKSIIASKIAQSSKSKNQKIQDKELKIDNKLQNTKEIKQSLNIQNTNNLISNKSYPIKSTNAKSEIQTSSAATKNVTIVAPKIQPQKQKKTVIVETIVPKTIIQTPSKTELAATKTSFQALSKPVTVEVDYKKVESMIPTKQVKQSVLDKVLPIIEVYKVPQTVHLKASQTTNVKIPQTVYIKAPQTTTVKIPQKNVVTSPSTDIHSISLNNNKAVIELTAQHTTTPSNINSILTSLQAQKQTELNYVVPAIAKSQVNSIVKSTDKSQTTSTQSKLVVKQPVKSTVEQAAKSNISTAQSSLSKIKK